MRLVLACVLLIALFVIPSNTSVTAQDDVRPQGRKPRITTITSRPPSTTASGSAADQDPTAPSRTTPAMTTTPPPTLPKNPRLVERLRGELPPGTDINTAAAGFRNQAQFVATVHASSSVGLPFASLKSRMLERGMSLAEAIADLHNGVDADVEAARAVAQAQKDLGTNASLARF
jgi:hypothetical protein